MYVCTQMTGGRGRRGPLSERCVDPWLLERRRESMVRAYGPDSGLRLTPARWREIRPNTQPSRKARRAASSDIACGARRTRDARRGRIVPRTLGHGHGVQLHAPYTDVGWCRKISCSFGRFVGNIYFICTTRGPHMGPAPHTPFRTYVCSLALTRVSRSHSVAFVEGCLTPLCR